MRNLSRPLCLGLALALAACGKDPFAKKGKAGGAGDGTVETPGLDTREEEFDKGLVAAYRAMRAAREKKNESEFRAAFATAADDDAMTLFTETATPRLVRILFQCQSQSLDGDRARLQVKEKVEERDPADPKSAVLTVNLDLDLALVKAGGAWKISSLKVDWK